MLNLDTHILILFLQGQLSEGEHRMIVSEGAAISEIILRELAELRQIGWVISAVDFSPMRDAQH